MRAVMELRAAGAWRKPLSQPGVGEASRGNRTLLNVMNRKLNSELAQKSRGIYWP